MKIGISGSFGMHNLGDEAILDSIISSVRARTPGAEFTVFSRNASHTRAYHGLRAIDAWTMPADRLVAELYRLDVLILGGGGIIYDADIRSYLRQAELAHLIGLPVVVYSVGAGPLEDPSSRRAVADVLSKASVLTTRDESSMRLLETCGVRAPVMEVAADPALLLGPCGVMQAEAVLVSQGVPVGERLVGVSVRQPDVTCEWLGNLDYHGLIARTIDEIVANDDVHALFVPMEPAHDIEESEKVIARMSHSERTTILQDGLRPAEVMGVIGLLELAVGMRLHFTIFAAVMGIPPAPLFYAPKVNAFVRKLGVGIEEQDMSRLTPEAYIEAIRDSWGSRHRMRPILRNATRSLKERALRSTTLLFEHVLGEEMIRD
ncbi:MAG: polysaccharide pyruvyl transferase family protein [Candidatus Aquicultorales bacterium]